MEPLIPFMTPSPGERYCRFVGDRIRFLLQDAHGRQRAEGWRGVLRTNLGRAEVLRTEILQAHTKGPAIAGASWRDLPMREEDGGWSLEVPLCEPGFFKAKAYLLDSRGWQHWPHGPDVGISVHPDCYRSGNVVYCAFTRMFGPEKTAAKCTESKLASVSKPLDDCDYTVIPPSGKFRDLLKALPHVFNTLGCRILHLLPVNPTPTTYARFGRYGSPYASLELTAVDPALVEFDRRTTGIDQFSELTYQAHRLGGRVFLDMVINHTGWGSSLQENHPEWFLRHPNGTFVSPGAWGVTWEDLVELSHQNLALWDELATVFLTWCQRGVDGFRCDAGYKVPVPAWQYIVARVQQSYPDTVFLLEGLGGAWEATEALLTEGGMQWAYSELFQNYTGREVASYLDHSVHQSSRVGLLVHYSETHDNERLAARGRSWSVMRNRLCALASVSGGFGFTCGVEWLATERIRVHGSTGMCWDNPANIVPELSRLNHLLQAHPCFFDGAKVTRLSPEVSPVCALLRQSQEGSDVVLALVNTDVANKYDLALPAPEHMPGFGELKRGGWVDLLGQPLPPMRQAENGLAISLPPGAAFCLAPSLNPVGLAGDAYRRTRAQAAWGLSALAARLPAERIGPTNWRTLAQDVDHSPEAFLARVARLDPERTHPDLQLELGKLAQDPAYSQVVVWTSLDRNRVVPVPPGHWLLIRDTARFRASLVPADGSQSRNVESIQVRDGYVACVKPSSNAVDAELLLERYGEGDKHILARVLYLAPEPLVTSNAESRPDSDAIVLLTNSRGGMARICVDMGRVLSKYDCVLGANLNQTLPVDRHIFAKRIRVWVNADGFISPLDYHSLKTFEPGPPACWNFVANAGDGRTVQVQTTAEMIPGHNTTLFRFKRPSAAEASGKQLPAEADVRLTVRVDIEDRNFHSETHRNGGAEFHFGSNTRPMPALDSRARRTAAAANPDAADPFIGFEFTPAADRQLHVFSDAGCYHPGQEWSENISHPVEQSRGQVPAGDGYSPGWFELPLPKGASISLTLTAEPNAAGDPQVASSGAVPIPAQSISAQASDFSLDLLKAIRAFVVRRDEGKTVVAGYPWFLDWGRDTFICARGLISAGMTEEVKQILLTFAVFEKDGTLPNTIFGSDASNRDTSDAPLWFGLVCEELAGCAREVTFASELDKITAAYLEQQFTGEAAPVEDAESLYAVRVPGSNRTLLEVLESIAGNYVKGTSNGIRMDPESGLIWSPSHFTWMDTNYPAGTPREGYPVEIQALWIRLLRQLASVSDPGQRGYWSTLAEKAYASIEKLFWNEALGYYADVLLAGPGRAAAEATADDALRSNCLFVVSLGLAQVERARRCVEAVRRYLVVPGALRSLAPLPVKVPLPIHAPDGRPLNDAHRPYWGRYEGDEDTRRKPAYHNGTAWTWTFPVFCEALVRAWNFSPEAVAAAKAYLGSISLLLNKGCLGQIPEVLDGDAPHAQRGCDAQAWSATEAHRVWQLLARER